jgi:acetyltransferase
MRALAEAGRVAAAPPPPVGSTGDAAPGPSLRATPAWPGPWPEHPAKELLRAWSLPVPPGELVGDASAATAAASRIGYPVALKVQSPDLPHKSDIGAVALGLASAEAVGSAYEGLVRRVSDAAPDARVTGVLVEAMARPGHPMIVGALVDPDFGPLVMLGSGGVHADVLADTAFALAPLSAEAAVGLVDRVRGSVLLRGLRGEPPADRAALERLLVAFSELAAACQDDFADIDLNPVLVHPAGEGVTVVDAWITGRAG